MPMYVEKLIESVMDGQDLHAILDTLSDGSVALLRFSTTSDVHRTSEASYGSPLHEVSTESGNTLLVRSFFDAYGDLRFSSINGVLINELTPAMMELVRISDEVTTHSDLIELMGAYEGPINKLYNEVIARRRRPQRSPDAHRSMIARRASQLHASSREAAARKSASSAKGKAAHAAVGRLNSRTSR